MFVLYEDLFNKINIPFLGVTRILFGIICLCKIFLLLKNRYEYFGVKGFYPYKAWEVNCKKNEHFSVFHYLKPNNFSVDLVLFFSSISSFFLTIGFCTEISCLTTFFLIMSLNNRNGYIFNGGDNLLRIMLFLLIFSNCGFYISIDNLIYNRNQLSACIDPWIVRLMQILVIKVYFDAFFSKILSSDSWYEGTGFYYSTNTKMLNRHDLNLYLNKSAFILLNYATLAAESVLVLGLLFNETSTICVFLLIIMHLLFEIFLRINLFGIIMVACLLLFLRIDIINILH